MISFVENRDIDRERWDDLVIAWSGQPYGLSWWLDVVSPGWKGLVKGEYEAVMPLPVKRKYGISYLVQPKFTQQLGVFGSSDAHEFLQNVPFLSYDINMNYRNTLNAKGLYHVNYVIDGTVKADANTRRNVAKSKVLEYKSVDEERYMKFWTTYNGHLSDPVLLNRLLDAATMRGMARVDGAFFDGELVAALFSVVTPARIITLAPVSSRTGFEKRGMFGLMNNLIEQCGTHVIDCEGSMLQGVARFYRGFGGIDQPYMRTWRFSPRRKT